MREGLGSTGEVQILPETVGGGMLEGEREGCCGYYTCLGLDMLYERAVF